MVMRGDSVCHLLEIKLLSFENFLALGAKSLSEISKYIIVEHWYNGIMIYCEHLIDFTEGVGSLNYSTMGFK